MQAMKAFIETNFKMIDIDNDGIIGANEYRYNCITRVAVENIQVVDDAYNKLVDVSIFAFVVFHRSNILPSSDGSVVFFHKL